MISDDFLINRFKLSPIDLRGRLAPDPWTVPRSSRVIPFDPEVKRKLRHPPGNKGGRGGHVRVWHPRSAGMDWGVPQPDCVRELWWAGCCDIDNVAMDINHPSDTSPGHIPVNTKHLYNIYTMLGQRRRRLTDIV